MATSSDEPAPSSDVELRLRAKGLGSAKRGVHAWTAERISSIALVPLMLWLVATIIVLHLASYSAFVAWLRRPGPGVLMVLSLIAIFHHTALGLQVIIEDYVHSMLKIPAMIMVRLACFALCVVGIVATLRIMLTS